jgi:hypothetical protein
MIIKEYSKSFVVDFTNNKGKNLKICEIQQELGTLLP